MRLKPLAGIRSLVRRVGGDERGLALTEFAMAAPVLLTIGLLGLETAQFGIANLRVSQMASIVADSASRVRDSMDEADIIDILTGAKMTGNGIGFAQNGRIILSSLERNAANTGQWIRWQRCDGAKQVVSSYGLQGKGENDASLQAMGPTGRQIAAQGTDAVMFVEIVYDYQPIVANAAIGGARTIRTTLAFNVRQRTNNALTNTTGVTPKACTTYAA